MLPYIEILGKTVQTYYVCAVLAAFMWIILSAVFTKNMLGTVRCILLPVLLAAVAVAGARLFNAVLNPSAYGEKFSVFTLEYTKLSLMGGLVLGAAAAFFYARLTRRDGLSLLDAMTVPAAVGIMILKLGCYLNGCCFGKPTSGIFGTVFPANAAKYEFVNSLPIVSAKSDVVHPTQLYELFGALAAIVLAVVLQKALHAKSGTRFAVFAAAFSIARLVVLPLRELPYPDATVKIAYPIFYAAIALPCVIFAIARNKNQRKQGTMPTSSRK